MQGKLIVIEGTDGSGKTEQTKLLVEHLQKDGHQVKTISFPTYGTPSAKAIEQYLRGEFGSAEFVGPYFAAMLYAFNRAHETAAMAADLKNGIHYIANRYTSANAGHQAGKITDKEERSAFLTWLEELEFEKLHIPRPDLTLLLHLAPALGQQLVEHKEARAYLKGKTKDIHEADLQHLQQAEAAFLEAATHYKWTVIKCAKDDAPTDPRISVLEKVRTLAEIHNEIYTHVQPIVSTSKNL